MRDSGSQTARNINQAPLDEPMDINSDGESTAEAHFQMYLEANEPPDDAPMETLASEEDVEVSIPAINPANSAVEVERFPEAAGS